jgi:uroporphyrinogen-III synthase
MTALPLAGPRVLVTRAAHQAGKLSEGLRALGFEPVEVPVIEIVPPESYELLDNAIRDHFNKYDWLIFTSTNAVRVVAERASENGIRLPMPQIFRIAAVGPSTATEARKWGLEVTLVPEIAFRAEGLIAALGEQMAGKRVLLARAAVARDVIPDALRAAGATVDVVDAYRNAMPESAPALLREALHQGIAAAAFTSSSTVTHLADAARQAGIAFPFASVAAISIGPVTTATLREHGWEPAAEASASDVPGLIHAVARALG